MPFIIYVENHLTTTLHLQGVADYSDHWHNGSLDTHYPISVILAFLSNMQHHHTFTKLTCPWVPPPSLRKWAGGGG